MKKIATVIATMAMCASAAFAAFGKGDAGTTTAQFLKMGAGARAAGLGEAFTAVTDNADSIYWNPAGLNGVEGKSLSVMHAVWFEDVTYDWASYAQDMPGIGTVGVGVQYLSYGNIAGADSSGLATGNFSPNDLSVALSYARTIRGIGLGANLKYISSKIRNSASAFAVDLGAMYVVNDRLNLGAAVQNAGTRMKFNTEEDALPLIVKLGGAYAIRPGWKVALDVNAPIDNAPFFGAGTEYLYHISNRMSATARIGYNTRAQDTGGMNGISAGLGFKYLNYALDYAFVPYGDLGNTHRISLGISF